MRRCFICGNDAEISNFCKNCFQEHHPIVKHFKPLVVKACKTCPAVSIEGSWVYEPTPETIPEAIRKKVHLNPEYTLKALNAVPLGGFEEGFHPVQYEVKVLVGKGHHLFEQTYEFPLQFEKEHCDHCVRAKSTYFEGTLQLRGASAVVEEFIDLAIEKGEADGNFLVRKERAKDGFDYYFTKNRFTLQLAQALRKQFGGDYLISRRHVTRSRQTGKDLYRVTVLYHSPLFFKDDVILHNKQLYKIVSTSGAVTAMNLETGKKEKISPEARKFKRLIPATTTVSKVQPMLEVLHPLTFQSVPVKNPRPKQLGERVKVVFADDETVYLY